ncbi:MAG: serine/threonine-protein kinase [Pseudanabaenaceae cyanobacterium]
MKRPQEPRYRLWGLVGRGQFGKVFCACERRRGGLVALKELSKLAFPTRNLLRELRLPLALQHPNVMATYTLLYEGDCRFLVVEYCEGGTLREPIERRAPLTWAQIRDLVVGVLAGLQSIHDLGAVHCDIKPENILLRLTRGGWQAKIGDFGIARQPEEDTGGMGVGSPAYMAPERFFEGAKPPADIYAVGILLYELLFWERPFSGKPSEMMAVHLNQRLAFPTPVPSALKVFLEKAVAKLPGHRFASPMAMAQALQELENHPDFASGMAQLWGWRQARGAIAPQPWPDSRFAQPVTGPPLALTMGGDILWGWYPDRVRAWRGPSLQGLAEIPWPGVGVGGAVVAGERFAVADRRFWRWEADRWQVLGAAGPLWAISPAGDWLATADRTTLVFCYWRSGRRVELPPGRSAIHFLTALDRHHALTATLEGQNTRLAIAARRGRWQWETRLPLAIAALMPGDRPGTVWMWAAHPPTLLVVTFGPYRVQRFDLAAVPTAIAPTPWGSALAFGDRLELWDKDGAVLGGVSLPEPASALAAIDPAHLAIATATTLHSLDLRQIPIDLVF